MLIISHLGDAHSVAVAQALIRNGIEPSLLDLSRFPAQSEIDLTFGGRGAGTMRITDAEWGEIDLTACRVAWWRRPLPFEVSPEVDDPVSRAFAVVEAREVFGGLWGMLDATWVNDPLRDDRAHRKPYQLQVAESLGLPVPDTLITNSPASALQFIRGRGGRATIFKAFNGTPQAWRETRVVGAAEMECLDQVRHAPVIFQDLIRGVDLRVTVIGNHIFAAEIDLNGGDYAVDFRMNYEHIRIRPTSLPDSIEDGIRRLMAALGLVYGAIDFRRTEAGEHLFLEINPAGQWLFVEQQTQQPITEALATTLLGLARAHDGR